MIKTDPLTVDFWKNVRVVDATSDLFIFPKKVDIQKAVPSDPEHCLYAECIRRVLHVRRVRIFKHIALIEHYDKKTGETIALRYLISSPGKRALRNFDLGIGEPVPCHLRAPTSSQQLETKQAKWDNLSEKEKEARRAKCREQKLQEKLGLRVPKHRVTSQDGQMGVRDGSGYRSFNT